jgi:DNA polymerase I-like protein with 3'-5' exonuclease and polymerase domains
MDIYKNLDWSEVERVKISPSSRITKKNDLNHIRSTENISVIFQLEGEIKEYTKEIITTDEAKQWTAYIDEQIKNATDVKEKEELKAKRIINFNSNDQLAVLLFTLLGKKGIKKTAGGSWSTDATTLEKMNLPITDLIIKRKKLIKAKDTYLLGWVREADDDWIVHPNFNLGLLTSHRSSANSPNTQNSPKRNKDMKVLTRNFVIPHNKNERLVSGDYTGAETRCMASIAKDEAMRTYMLDETTDMHRDSAKDVFKLHGVDLPPELLKELRGIIKNGFVFPEFYGDYYVNCAYNMWESIR